MIRCSGGTTPVFALHTDQTSYVFRADPSGHLEHLYYGERINVKNADGCEVFTQTRAFELGNIIAYSEEHPLVFLEDMCLEMSSQGHGDLREPFVEIVKPNGSRSSDFLFKSYVISEENPAFDGLPHSYAEVKAEHLCVTLADGGLKLELHYIVYPECDVITRYAVLENGGGDKIEVERLLSMTLDLPDSGYSVSSFHGAWTREMNRRTTVLSAGRYVVESRAGCSSNRANPFFMLHAPEASEDSGEVYGFNLIYSGNHYSSIEINAYGKTRVVSGIQPQGFRAVLESGERFEAPEAVMTYSVNGFSGQSRNMHSFVQHHIVRGAWKMKPRPVLLNTWEACYFNANEGTLVSLGKAARELGIEMLVLDDGWFGERNDDSRSLGDWFVNQKKFPRGLRYVSDKLGAMGLQFGLWVEPEMISVNSELYKAHPDWAMAVQGELHSEGRHQRILDLSNPEVCDFVIEKMSEVFSSADIKYVKWDMNRVFSDAFSPYLPAKRQGETAHRYILGLYRIMGELTKRFPEILFEGCASGGNRFDLGILCYFPQIWGSDNTDALSRTRIQEGYSYAYPQSCVSAHVAASPNHQTLRETSLETRFNVAAFGVLGYELDVRDLNSQQKQEVRAHIELYKKLRETFQFGSFYRVKGGNIHQWMCISKDRKTAVGMIIQELTEPNTQSERFFAKGLDPNKRYRFYSVAKRLNLKQFGSLINTMSPVHIKQDSLIHNVAVKAVKMNGEAEEHTASGKVLMNAGVSLKPAYSGTGLNENVRVFPDFASRMYFFEEIE